MTPGDRYDPGADGRRDDSPHGFRHRVPEFSMTDATNRPVSLPPDAVTPAVPDYLKKTYAWAYLNRFSLALLDRRLVVSAILWGHCRHVQRAVLEKLRPGAEGFASRLRVRRLFA